TQVVLGRVLDVVLRLLHPTMPFVTEVLWQALTDGQQSESIMVAPWPTAADNNGGASTDEVAFRRIEESEKLITELRRYRADQGFKPSQKVPGRLDFAAVDLQNQEDMVRNLANFTAPEADFTASASIEVRLSQGTVEISLDTSDAIEVDAERKRLEKYLDKALKELDQTGSKLSNEAFLSKAPEHVVDKIRERQTIAQEEVERINTRLEALK